MANASYDLDQKLVTPPSRVLMDASPELSGTSLEKIVYETQFSYSETIASVVNHWVWFDNGWQPAVH